MTIRVPLGDDSPVSNTDLDLVRRAFRPLAGKAPGLFRGTVLRMIESLTHQDVRDLYAGAGGEDGIRALMEAILRIGKGETLGAP